MPISIVGNGSITGLTAGGLPDASVVDLDLATGISSSKLTGALPALDGSSLTGVGVTGIVSTANATAITIDSSENVGIGVTPDPGFSGCKALDIGSVGGIFYEANYGGLHEAWNVYTANGSTYNYKTTSYATDYEQINGTHKWKIAGNGSADAAISFTEAMRIHNDGNVAIGTTQNGARLLAYTSNNMPGLVVNCTDSTTFSSIVSQISCSRDVQNHTYTLLRASNGGGVRMACYDSGNIQNTNNSYGSLSDERIKQDISDASSQWDDIKALKVRKYKLKRAVNKDGVENTPFHLGVIAQELESSNMSGLVDHVKPEKEDTLLHADFGTWDGLDAGLDDEGNEIGEFTPGDKVKSIKYSILYMKSIKALQEAMARIESLESRIETLENA
jgi:hypothetical protein